MSVDFENIPSTVIFRFLLKGDVRVQFSHSPTYCNIPYMPICRLGYSSSAMQKHFNDMEFCNIFL